MRTFLLLFLAACAAPNAMDVAADRDRWTAVRDVTADNAVDAQERPHLNTLLMAWDAKLAADEQAVAKGDTTVADLIRVYGLAVVQVYVTPELKARAPEVFRLVDKNSDGMLDETELLAVDPKSPVFAMVVVTTAAQLLAKRK